jgi:hypothetical protein
LRIINKLLMKKFFLIPFLLLSFAIHSQTFDYTAIRKVISETYPEIDISNKLLAISIWNSTDKMSRDMNAELHRTYTVYKNAKLSGGLKGVVFISISNDTDEMNFKIAEKKDALNFPFTLCDFQSYHLNGKLSKMKLNKNITNVVFDSSGKLIYTNLQTEVIFKSFNTLITR